jgi:nitrate/TMAO reductase-like tetraheme cytochrome c subunit
VTGAVIGLVACVGIVFLLVFSLAAHRINPYLGILLYMALPSFLVAGLLLVPAGMFLRWRRLQRYGEIRYRKWPHVDLNDERHRKAALIFSVGTFIFVVISAVGIYQAYHYTDSVAFCGLTCHAVMNPEFTTYQDSPHARVRCVACHIGPGAGWYARSKLSGLYQVYATLADKYPRPVPTPISDLRPAQETCEQCHWPSQFYGGQQRQFNYYLYDKTNTHWQINMLVKTGGGNPKTSQTSGIHWHMNIEKKVEYIARDRKRQDIPWIRITDRVTGRVTVYQDTSQPLSPEELQRIKPRIMDCMDCHNRPSHDFHSPDYEVNLGILTGKIDGTIPWIKTVAVKALGGDYATSLAAQKGIRGTIEDFYRLEHPGIYSLKKEKIIASTQAVLKAFTRNVFPEMNARWSEYPDNIGHFIFRGCMRCHDGKHRGDDGTVIAHDCRTCHIILSQGSRDRHEVADLQAGLEFRHPVNIGGAWKGGACYECHTGKRP